MQRDPGDETDYIDKCITCGEEAPFPGEDECYKCLGRPKPIYDRPYDESRIGSEEWKKEIKENWDLIMGAVD